VTRAPVSGVDPPYWSFGAKTLQMIFNLLKYWIRPCLATHMCRAVLRAFRWIN